MPSRPQQSARWLAPCPCAATSIRICTRSACVRLSSIVSLMKPIISSPRNAPNINAAIEERCCVFGVPALTSFRNAESACLGAQGSRCRFHRCLDQFFTERNLANHYSPFFGLSCPIARIGTYLILPPVLKCRRREVLPSCPSPSGYGYSSDVSGNFCRNVKRSIRDPLCRRLVTNSSGFIRKSVLFPV